MGNHDNCIAVLAADIFQQLQDLLGSVVVQCTGRLVAQQNVRILDNGSADRRPLLLSAGKLVRQLVAVLIQPQRFQQVVYVQRVVAQVRTDFHIFLNIQIRDQIVHLENIPQMLPAVQRQILFIHFPNGFPVNGDLAAVRRFNAADDVQQRGFSGTGRPQQYTNLAFFNADVNAPKHIDTAFTLSEMFLDLLNL